MMTQTSPENGAETTILSESETLSTDSPAVLLRNEDDTDHALDVRIADGEAVLTRGCHTVAGDSQYAIAATAADGELLQVDLRADHGGAASLTVDLRRSKRVLEFVVRRNTIVVAGLN